MITVSPTKQTVLVGNATVTAVTLSVPRVTVIASGVSGPPGRDAELQLSNTFVLPGDGLSGGGSLSSNVIMSVDSSVLRSGTITVDSANSRVGINELAPKT